MRNATVAIKSTWDGLKAVVDAGASLENTLTAFNDAYSGSSSQYASEVNWSTKSEVMWAGAFDAAVNNRYGEFLEQYADYFKQEAYSEGRILGLNSIQSQVFAQAFNEGLAGRVLNFEDSSSWSHVYSMLFIVVSFLLGISAFRTCLFGIPARQGCRTLHSTGCGVNLVTRHVS